MPVLFVQGDADEMVPLGQSIVLAKALIDAGVMVTMKTLAGAGHEDKQLRNAENQRLIEDF